MFTLGAGVSMSTSPIHYCGHHHDALSAPELRTPGVMASRGFFASGFHLRFVR